jgi:hypothetical protein
MIKPGYRTTEFWITVAVVFLSLLMTSGLIGDASPVAKIIGLIVDTAAAMGYTYSRGLAKS